MPMPKTKKRPELRSVLQIQFEYALYEVLDKAFLDTDGNAILVGKIIREFKKRRLLK